MTEEVSELLKKAMTLPPEARAALAGSLLDSLDETVDESAEAEWEKEILSRVAELKMGTIQTIPWTEVRRRLSAKLSQGG
jgi:putative addiction module component (TIGR02574 family)